MSVDRCVWMHLLDLVSTRQRRDRDVATPAGTHRGLYGPRRGGTRRAHPHRHGHGGSARLPPADGGHSGPRLPRHCRRGAPRVGGLGWGVLGLALTAASALPGMVGGAARLATHVVLPAGPPRTPALVLGLGLGVAPPLAGVATTVLATPAVAAVPAAGVPDWPAARPSDHRAQEPTVDDPVPDWPYTAPVLPQGGEHVVMRGDCLWHIAESRLLASSGAPPTD